MPAHAPAFKDRRGLRPLWQAVSSSATLWARCLPADQIPNSCRIRVQLVEGFQRLVIPLSIRGPALIFVGDTEFESCPTLEFFSLTVEARIVCGKGRSRAPPAALQIQRVVAAFTTAAQAGRLPERWLAPCQHAHRSPRWPACAAQLSQRTSPSATWLGDSETLHAARAGKLRIAVDAVGLEAFQKRGNLRQTFELGLPSCDESPSAWALPDNSGRADVSPLQPVWFDRGTRLIGAGVSVDARMQVTLGSRQFALRHPAVRAPAPLSSSGLRKVHHHFKGLVCEAC
ncbi:hypothetical protein FQR65_LT20905 [Abscondita terminalis]|nr:hypothetical protein FQR65_LT20905 [Abscondita terminalis]